MQPIPITLREGVARDITAMLSELASGIENDGFLTVMSGDSTTGLFISDSHLEGREITAALKNLFPARRRYAEMKTSPCHFAADLKAAALGKSVALICSHGKLVLPEAQRVFALTFEMDRDAVLYALCK